MMPTVLVVGAQEGSLGAQVVASLRRRGCGYFTAGISGQEDVPLDLVDDPMGELRQVLVTYRPQHVVVTAGVNGPDMRDDDPSDWYEAHFAANCIGPMRLLAAWEDLRREEQGGLTRSGLGHYVVISSNSATVPRQGSAAYCASKAALSQAIRCKAREFAGGDALGLVTYGYEPGLLAGTPMTAETEARFGGAPLTRMRGAEVQNGISARALAEMVVAGLWTGVALNGVLVPFDAGER